MDVTVFFTSTKQVSSFPPHAAVITAVPLPFAVIRPVSLTTAIVSSLLLHVTLLSFGAFVLSCFVSPLTPSSSDVVYRRTFSSLMDTIPLSTTTVHLAVTPLAVAVITATPSSLPVTLPLLTVAIRLSEVVHLTVLLGPTTEGTSLILLPSPLVLSFISLTFKEIVLSRTVTSQDAVMPLADAVITALPGLPTDLTTPLPRTSETTVATVSSLLLHTISLEAPLDTALSVIDLPFVSALSEQYIVAFSLFILRTGSTTVITHFSRGNPMPEEIVVFPLRCAVTVPFWSTLAIFTL